MKIHVIRLGIALLFSAAGAGFCHAADCAALYALAQQHANDMARRNSLDHAGFMKHAGRRGPPPRTSRSAAPTKPVRGGRGSSRRITAPT